MKNEGSRLFDESLIGRRRIQQRVMLVAGALVLLRLMAEFSPTLRRPDLALLDVWQSVRATDRPSQQIAIVAIDEKSIARFGPPAWPRNQFVPLIERLSAAGAGMIGFDFTFGTLDREKDNNALLAAAMRKAGNVVFGYEFTDVGDPSPPGVPPPDAVARSAFARFDAVALPPAPSLIEPEPALAEAAAAIGHVRIVESEDGRIRALLLAVQHGDKAYPNLGLQMARIYTGTPAHEVELMDGVVGMGTWDIPVSAAGEMLLSWPAGGEKAYPEYSFLDVVRGDVPDDAFRGKAVLVAGTASGLDDRDFPFALEAPGVLSYAAFLDNVFRYDFVRAPTWAWFAEWALLLAVCGLGVWLLPRLPTPLLLAGVPLLALLLGGAAAFLFVQKGLWLKVFYPGVALVALLGSIVALRLTASERETRDVAAEKVENQKLLGLSFQEKGMLDMAFATFNKLPFTEDLKLVYVNLGLDYENRGQRDKAYLVYKKLFDIDPRFEDVAQRLERLSQTGLGMSAFSAPTGPLAGHTPPGAEPAAAFSLPAEETVGTEDVTGLLPTTARTPAETAVAAPTGLPVPPAGTPPPARRTPTPAQHPAPAQHLPPTGMHTPSGSATPAPGGPALLGARFGRYEVELHLGRGGMGDVYLVRDIVINRKAALKTIRVDTNLEPSQAIEMRQRFYREAQTAGKLTHPNIVTVYDVGEDLGVSYIVMEYVEGHTLTQLMKKQRLSLAQAKHVVCHAGTGLDYAHQNGVFHRDVKPDNIMVSKTGIVKVMDFGIARVVESELTRTGSVMGTPAYMSPEQVNGERIDARSDIFSLGVILYELLTGKKPFAGETVSAMMFAIIQTNPVRASEANASVHSAWDEILRKALAKDREQRYAAARDFVQAIRAVPI